MQSNQGLVAAQQSHHAHDARHHLVHLRAVDLIGNRTDIFSLSPNDSVESAAQKLKNWRVRTSAVADDVGNVVGVFGQSDIASRVVAVGFDPKTVTVRDVMTCNPITVDIESDLLTLVRIMRKNKISHVVVTQTTAEGEQHFGNLSANDILEVIAKFDTTTDLFKELAG